MTRNNFLLFLFIITSAIFGLKVMTVCAGIDPIKDGQHTIGALLTMLRSGGKDSYNFKFPTNKQGTVLYTDAELKGNIRLLNGSKSSGFALAQGLITQDIFNRLTNVAATEVVTVYKDTALAAVLAKNDATLRKKLEAVLTYFIIDGKYRVYIANPWPKQAKDTALDKQKLKSGKIKMLPSQAAWKRYLANWNAD